MSERQEHIHTEHEVPKTRRCQLLDVARSSADYRSEPVCVEDLRLMGLMHETHLDKPFCGSRRLHDQLEDHGEHVNRKRVQRLLRQMGLRTLYPRRRTSQPGQGHKNCPYLLRDVALERANQVWAEPGVGQRSLLYPGGQGLHVFGRDHGLAHPTSAVLADLEQSGQRLLH